MGLPRRLPRNFIKVNLGDSKDSKRDILKQCKGKFVLIKDSALSVDELYSLGTVKIDEEHKGSYYFTGIDGKRKRLFTSGLQRLLVED